MSSIGPQLPPHLLANKRKRTPDDDEKPSARAHGPDALPPPAGSKFPRRAANDDEIDLADDDDDDGTGPRPPASKPSIGPSLPNNDEEIDLSDSGSDTGPAPPAASRPTNPAPAPAPVVSSTTPVDNPSSPSSDDDDDDDDDYGPSLPSVHQAPTIGPSLPPSSMLSGNGHDGQQPAQRDSWMLAPPPAGEAYSERDPTRIRARKFASKSSSSSATAAATSASSGVSSIWTETPEEKLRRLQNAVLGREEQQSGPDAGNKGPGGSGSAQQQQQERDRRIAANIEAQRGASLYDEHSNKRRQGGVGKGEEEDDPSSRPFDRDKDMALGGQIGTAKRRELVSRAAGFGGKFQKGSYL